MSEKLDEFLEALKASGTRLDRTRGKVLVGPVPIRENVTITHILQEKYIEQLLELPLEMIPLYLADKTQQSMPVSHRVYGEHAIQKQNYVLQMRLALGI